IRQAAEAIGTERLIDCDLYVTLEPCTMCAGAISFARIRRLYYGAADPKGGAVDSGVRFFAQPTCHHVPEVYSAVGETEAATLLKEFFKVRRERACSPEEGSDSRGKCGRMRDCPGYRFAHPGYEVTAPGKTPSATSPSRPDSPP